MLLLNYPIVFYPVAVLAILLTGISRGGFGAGASGLAVPRMSMLIAPPEAADLILPILCAMDLFSVHAYRGRCSLPHLKIMLTGCLLGVALGGFTFGLLPSNAIRLLIGGIAVAFSLNKWFALTERISKFLAKREHSAGPVTGMVCGLLVGFTSTLAHAGGPPFAVYFLSKKLDKPLIVATSAAFSSSATTLS